MLSTVKKWLLLTLLLAPSAFAQVNVVTTTGIIGDTVAQIGGDKVKVTALMGSGVDPHLYKATQGDIGRLMKADVIFYNGLHLEGKMQDILEKLARRKAVRVVSRDIAESHLLSHQGVHDPHIWFDLELWMQAARTIHQDLVALHPEYKTDFDANAKAYLTRLETLHQWVKTEIATIPKQQRLLITAHDAFGYFGKAYDIEVSGLQGISTASEFGLHDLTQISKLLVERGVKAVFVESSVPKKFIRSLQQGVSNQGHQVAIGGELFSDALGKSGTPEGTYIGMVEHNVNTIVKALK